MSRVESSSGASCIGPLDLHARPTEMDYTGVYSHKRMWRSTEETMQHVSR